MKHADHIVTGTRGGHAKYRYNPAVRAGGFVFVAGMIGRNPDGSACATAAEEYHAAFREIAAALEACGATMADIVAIDSFHVTGDLLRDIGEMTEVRAHYMDAPHPTTTAIGVSSLAVPGARVEIKVTAFVGK